MSEVQELLLSIAKRFDELKTKVDVPNVHESIESLKDAAAKAAAAFCGSWFGYHSRVYYRDLDSPPAGARFSPEWGLMATSFVRDTQGDWVEYTYSNIYDHLTKQTKGLSLDNLTALAARLGDEIGECREELISCMTAISEAVTDTYLTKLLEKTRSTVVASPDIFIEAIRPSGKFFTRDMAAVSNGMQVPPHIALMAEIATVNQRITLCSEFAQIARQAASHLNVRRSARLEAGGKGTKVFIGHGRSSAWKDLKDFLQDRLHLGWEEFNRVSAAGVPTATRLDEMLSSCNFAFLVLTAEDESADGALQARMNVIHEVGLFQSKLGFSKAIILLEEGCAEFSNVHGLGQIRFPKGNLSAKFEEIRMVLERENILS